MRSSLLLVAMLELIAAGCGGDPVPAETTPGADAAVVSQLSTDAGVSEDTPKDFAPGPIVSRPAPLRDCPRTPIVVSADRKGTSESATSPAQCTKDADCTEGRNGQCLKNLRNLRANGCVYDRCFVDGDCGATEACLCRDDPASNIGFVMSYKTNLCVDANCRTDGDCGPGGLCSPSLSGCYEGGFYCHTPLDTCRTDADCKTDFHSRCLYSKDLSRWTCMAPAGCPAG
jgi:hypothetical protein